MKILSFQLIFNGCCQGHLITIIKFYFIIDIYQTSQPAFSSLLLIAAWQISNLPNTPFKLNNNIDKAKRKLADILFLTMLCFTINE